MSRREEEAERKWREAVDDPMIGWEEEGERLKAIYEARDRHWRQWLMPVVVLTVVGLLIVGIPSLVVWSVVDAPPYFWQDQGISAEEALRKANETNRRLGLIEQYDEPCAYKLYPECR